MMGHPHETWSPPEAIQDPLPDAHCPHCGYSLRGLPENRCPECGRAFDVWMIATAAPVDKLRTKRGTGCKGALHALP
jgi:hypothetical protein